MRVAISGSHGFIGKALTNSLKAAGHEIHPIVRHPPRRGEIGIDLTRHSLDCSQIEGEHIGVVDTIFHLAGEPLTPNRWGAKRREAIRSSRIGSTDLIARAVAAAPSAPRVLVTMSAIGYYGDRGSEILTEKSTAGEGFLAQVCRAWEAATAPAKAIGVRVVHARTGIVIGHDGGIVGTMAPLFRLGLGGPLGDGSQWMSTIALSDEIRALIFLATNDEIQGACNLTSPIPVTNAKFAKTFGHLLHRPALLRVPAPVIRLAMGQRTAESIALASQRVEPVRLQEAGFTFDFPHIEDALKAAL
jgi:hypothetical protein